MIDELRALAIFAKVVEVGSFRSAAKALKLSPSVISHHVAQLEERLNVTLLYRSTRQLSLTHEGEKLFLSAKEMLAAAEQGLNSIAYNVPDPAGSLKLTLPALLTKSKLVKDIADFAKKFSKVSLSINFSDVQQDIIHEGFDLAIRIGNLKESSLKSKKLFDLKRKLVVSPDYMAGKRVPHKPEELTSWEWIGVKMRSHTRTFIHQNGKSCTIHFNPRIVVDSVDAVSQLVIAGLGLSTPPLFLIEEDIKKNRLINPLANWDPESVPVYALWPPNASKESLTYRLIEFLEIRKKTYF